MSGSAVRKLVKAKSGSETSQPRKPAAVSAKKQIAPIKASSNARAPGDRRAIERLDSPAAPIATNADGATRPDYLFYLPRQPRAMAMLLFVAFLFAAGVARTVPFGLPLIAGIASILILSVGSYIAKLERRSGISDSIRQLMVFVGIVVPMACAGFAMAGWVQAGLPWQWAVATLLCINAASAALFGKRVVSLFTAKISIWSAFALVDPTPLTVSAVLGAAIALMLVGRFEWKAAEKKRVQTEARERVAARAEDILRSFEETGQGWFWETDRRGLISYISPSAAEALSKSVEHLLGKPLSEIVDPDHGTVDAERTLAFHLSARSAFHDLELRAATASDERWWALTGRPVYDSFKNFCGFRGHGSDLTEKRRSEQQVSRLAHYDSLTGLANRLQMGQALEQILAAPRERDRACTVLLLDLDRFKHVNDTLGHPAGDALLVQVAQRLEVAVGGKGRCGRLGGDEFQVIVPG
ncbi:MAG: diguanylate cyclase, partial [Pseudomonadota bacterium]